MGRRLGAWAAAIVVGLAGCVGPAREPARWEPHVFLADAVAAARGWREAPTATIDGRTHYVLNDVGPLPLELDEHEERLRRVGATEQETIRVSCPSAWRAKRVLVETALIEMPRQGREWRTTEGSFRFLRRDGIVRCDEDATASLTVTRLRSEHRYVVQAVSGMVTAPARTVTPWVDLPERAALRTAIGLRHVGSPPTAPVVMRVAAEAPGGAQADVGSWTLAPGTVAASTWQPVEVALDAIRRTLGPRVRLVLETTAPRAAGAMTVPFWGDPTIMAGIVEPAAPPPRNVVLISLDTLRADRLGVYGYPVPITPTLDRLAAGGTVMDRNTAPANWTLPSHASMLTGLHPCGHGFRGQPERVLGARPFPPGVHPLAELLREAGWATAAFTENAYVDRLPFHRGFGRFEANRRLDGAAATGLAEETFAEAAAWLAARDGAPFFLFVHTYQVHAPYRPPADELARVPTPLPLPPGGLAPAADSAEAAAAYVAEVAYTDRLLGEFLGALDRLGLAERTIVLVTSDHGEGFGEHGRTGHGFSLYQEELWIPMIWHAPGLVAAGRRVDALTTLADVAPTLLGLLGRPVPPWMQGKNLAPLLDPERTVEWPRARVVPIEGMFTGEGARGWNWKLLTTKAVRRPSKRLLWLATDPTEVRPAQVPQDFVDYAVTSLRRECARTRRLLEQAGGAVAPAAPIVDPERARKLRALGYAE